MTEPSWKFRGSAGKSGRVTAAIALWLLCTLSWISFARGQEGPGRPGAAVGQQTEPTTLDRAASENTSTSSDVPDDLPEAMLPHLSDTRYWLSGQMNFIFQTHPPFHAPYSGRNSLNPNYEKATSRVITLYTGVRLNNSTELLLDIEEAGGAGLTTGLGIAGAPNLDVVRNPSLSKVPYLGRGMIHKVFALSKDKIENQRNALALFDELPARRLEILRAPR